MIINSIDSIDYRLSTISGQIDKFWGLLNNVCFFAETLVGSMLPFGALFGALPSGYIADRIGRRYTAMVMDIPFILAWITLSFANSVGWLYLGRFLIGK